MTWFLQSANQTEADKVRCAPFLAVDLDFSSGHLRVWSGHGTMSINGNDYLGIGTMGSVTFTPDSAKMVAEQKTYRLSGVDPSLISESDIDNCFGRSVTEYLGFLTEAGALVAAPEVNWEGRMGIVRRADSSEPYIEVGAKSRLADLDKSDDWCYTHEHQQSFFAGDDGLKLVPSTITAEVIWQGGKVGVGVIGTLVSAAVNARLAKGK